MKESETFGEFYAKSSHILNTSLNLGESISEVKTVKRILGSLPERFLPKVVALEEYHKLDSKLSVEELVGILHTYEANHCQDKKGKDITLMS